MYVADGKYELSVLVDHAVGASSIKDGQIEIMLHRYQLGFTELVLYLVRNLFPVAVLTISVFFTRIPPE